MSLKPTGQPISHDTEERDSLELIRERFRFKDDIKQSRILQLREQADFMQFMLPYFQRFQSFNPRSATVTPPQLYKSAMLHTTWNILAFGSTKLSPDFIDFSPERTQRRSRAITEAQNLSYVVNLSRRKGNYVKAIKNHQRDLVRGEGYMYQEYTMDKKGEPVGLDYKHIPFEDCWFEYGDTDVLIIKNLSVFEFSIQFGEDLLKKVTFGSVVGPTHNERGSGDGIDRRNARPVETRQQMIQVIYYIDPASMTYQVIMGGTAFFWKDLQGKDYPFMRDDDTGFQPVKRRTFYPETPGDSYFGYGPMDLLIPLARLENNIVNSTAIRAMKAASRPVIMASSDPDDAKAKYEQYLQEISFSDHTKPFFVQDSATGTTMKPFVVDEGVDNGNMQFWNDFFLDQATIRTRINFRSLTDLAPTGIQDELRIQLEETANKIVLKSNADTDRDFALESVYMLKGGDSKFHDIKVWLKQSEEDLLATAEDAELVEQIKGPDGELPTEEVTIRKFLKTIEEPEYDITPRTDGIFDNKTAIEIRATEKALALFGQFPGVVSKLGKMHMDELVPTAGITEADFQLTPEAPAGGQSPLPGPGGPQEEIAGILGQ